MNRKYTLILTILTIAAALGVAAAQPYDTISRPPQVDTVRLPEAKSGTAAASGPQAVNSTRRLRHAGRGGADQLDIMQSQARQLRDEAEKLGKMAQRLDDEADGVEDNVDALLDKADRLQEKLQAVSSISDSAQAGQSDGADLAAVNQFLEQQKQMIGALRANAAALAAKSREMAAKVREMEQSAGKKEDAADSLEDAAQVMAEELDTEPYQVA
jgi:methyl-accepting chemotaxis protein